jgi:hypothetical protein
MTPIPELFLLWTAGSAFPGRRQPYAAGPKIGLNNTIKDKFICSGKCSIEKRILSFAITIR